MLVRSGWLYGSTYRRMPRLCRRTTRLITVVEEEYDHRRDWQDGTACCYFTNRSSIFWSQPLVWQLRGWFWLRD